jgi:hypothetical protein
LEWAAKATLIELIQTTAILARIRSFNSMPLQALKQPSAPNPQI